MYIIQPLETVHKGTYTYTEHCSIVTDGVTGQVLICNSSMVGQYVQSNYKTQPALTVAPSVFKQVLKVYQSRGATMKYDSRR